MVLWVWSEFIGFANRTVFGLLFNLVIANTTLAERINRYITKQRFWDFGITITHRNKTLRSVTFVKGGYDERN